MNLLNRIREWYHQKQAYKREKEAFYKWAAYQWYRKRVLDESANLAFSAEEQQKKEPSEDLKDVIFPMPYKWG